MYEDNAVVLPAASVLLLGTGDQKRGHSGFDVLWASLVTATRQVRAERRDWDIQSMVFSSGGQRTFLRSDPSLWAILLYMVNPQTPLLFFQQFSENGQVLRQRRSTNIISHAHMPSSPTFSFVMAHVARTRLVEYYGESRS